MPPDENLTRPITGPASTENTVTPSRRAQIKAAIGLVPKNATLALGGDADGDADADETPAAPPATPPVSPVATAPETPPPAATESGATPQAEPTPGPEGQPNPWDKVTAIEAELLEAKKALKALRDQVSTPKAPPPPPGPVAPSITAADLTADPVGALARLGLDYQGLTQRVLEGGPTAQDALSAVERVRQEIVDGVTAARGEAAAIRNQLTRERLEMGLHKVISSDPRMDILKADPEAAVTAAISEMAKHFQETGERLPDVAILARVQGQWVDRLKKLDSHGAVRKLLIPQSGTPPANPPATTPQIPASASPAKPGPNGSAPATLTNDVHASSPPGGAPVQTGSRALDRRSLIHKAVKELVPPNALGEEE